MTVVSRAACARCGTVQDTIDMKATYVGVYVCTDKAQCVPKVPGMKPNQPWL